MIYALILILVTSVYAKNCSIENMTSMKCKANETEFRLKHNPYEAYIECTSGPLSVDNVPVISDYTNQTLDTFQIYFCRLSNESVQKYVEALNTNGARNIILHTITNIKRENLVNITTEVLTIKKSNITSDAFRGLSVNTIELFQNHLTLNNESFRGSTNLKALKLIDCNLTDLPLGLFQYTPDLQNLTLSKNRLKHLSSSHFYGLSSLEFVDLSKNEFTSISDMMWQGLPSLKKLVIFHNPLENIVGTVFRGTAWTEVLFSHNTKDLTLGSLAMADMTHLRSLQLRKCRITVVPKDLLNNTNEITSIDLSKNVLQSLPDELFEGKSKLEILLLNENNLESVSDALLKCLPSLRQLHLENNNINEISGSTFTLNNLNSLYLDYNKLSSLDSITLPQLVHLSLLGNRFRRVPLRWITSFPKLKSLNMSNNALDELTEEDIAALPPGAVVNLSNNNISTIHLSYDAALPTLILDNVPLRCDCLMHPYAKRLNKGSTAMCNSTLLADVPLTDFVCEFQCPKTCSCLINPETKTVQIDCIDPPSYEQYQDIEAFRKKTYRHFLDLDTSVTLRTIPIERTPSHVTRLNLTNLKMQKLPPLSVYLQDIDLSYNELTEPPLDLVREEGPRIWFRNNSVPCDCAHMNIWETIKSHNVNFVDRDDMFCGDKQLVRLDVAKFCDAQNNIIIAAIFGILATFCSIIAFLIYRHRTNVKVMVYEIFKWRMSREYDAFVFFAHCDLEFIKWHLLPILEEDERLRIGLNQREFTPGDWLPKSIETVVKKSRRIVLVLSKDTLESKYELRVLEMALELAVHRGAVVLMLGEVDESKLTKSIKKNIRQAYQIHFKDPAFWQKLICLLRGPKLMCV